MYQLASCSVAFIPANTVSGGVLTYPADSPAICGRSDDQLITIPFTPFTIDDPAGCVNPQDQFTYSVAYDPTADKAFTQVEVSKQSSEVYIKFLSGGPTVETLYPDFKIIASLPTGQTYEIPFKLLITDCNTQTV